MTGRHTIRTEAPSGFEIPSFNPEPWVSDAACAEVDPDMFFPEPRDAETARNAKRVCAGCPVRLQCREFALRTHQRHGVWGGLTFHHGTASRKRAT